MTGLVKIVVGAWASFLAATLLAGCSSVKEPEFREIQHVRISRLALDKSTLAFDLYYFNPNPFGVKLRAAEGDMWLDEQLLGHFRIDTLIHIPARAAFRLPVELEAQMGQVFRNSLAALLNKEVQIMVKGRARLGKGFVYIHYPIQYEGKQKLGDLLR